MSIQFRGEKAGALVPLGPIVRLQVQTAPLKVAGGEEGLRYDPAPLRSVTQLWLSAYGVFALLPDGSHLLDVHHQDYPGSRNRGGKNGVSLGFTAHYQAMRARFGEHLTDGCAGENILIATEQMLRLEQLTHGLLIVRATGEQPVVLTRLRVATPCLEFTRFALGPEALFASPPELKAALQFLDRGQRGFYATCPAEEAVAIACGDQVFALPAPRPEMD
ncbi:MAG: hypothetical protein IRZ31_02920 [Thermogemmatispora sp.]|jgi:hypothetical protein|uniref:hypothetical protein n=1 Tax=Thermogemmatispora sp. TaxID=1968838 RepID=UPI00262786EB|nr:hypothetical protein [Thermogemmatispora sp.]MBX5455831.1 hypothetical protein [Thermogemmatispora sp.]